MAIIRSFDIKRLKPFHREGDRMPKPAPEKSDELTQLDSNLRPEEQSYISHYLGYADVLLNEPGEQEGKAANRSQSQSSNIIELPAIQEPDQPDKDDPGEKNEEVA